MIEVIVMEVIVEIVFLVAALWSAAVTLHGLGELAGAAIASRRRDRSRPADPMPLYDTLPPDVATLSRVRSIRLETVRRQ